MKIAKEDIKIIWLSEQLPLDVAAAEEQIRSELVGFMGEEQELSDLMFHTVFLNPLTIDADSVSVVPADDDPNAVECHYEPITQWVSMADIPLGKDDDDDDQAQ